MRSKNCYDRNMEEVGWNAIGIDWRNELVAIGMEEMVGDRRVEKKDGMFR